MGLERVINRKFKEADVDTPGIELLMVDGSCCQRIDVGSTFLEMMRGVGLSERLLLTQNGSSPTVWEFVDGDKIRCGLCFDPAGEGIRSVNLTVRKGDGCCEVLLGAFVPKNQGSGSIEYVEDVNRGERGIGPAAAFIAALIGSGGLGRK